MTQPMEGLKDGWFVESNPTWPGEAYCLQVDSVLYHKQSPFQDVLIFKSTNHGNVLVLNGIIQCTERDEFAYQEMISHIPLTCHPCPRRVLVIGGGDGGVVREVVKHPEVEKVVLCELDETVVEASKKYLPGLAVGFDSPKLSLHIGDGFDFMRQTKEKFDVIITDSSDPEGPAEFLFQRQYFELMRSVLTEDGVLCCQGEGMWLDLPLIVEMHQFCRELFSVVGYAYSSVPTYSSGVIGYCLCSKNPNTDFRTPLRALDNKIFRLRYYNAQVHSAAFVLPEFAHRALYDEESAVACDSPCDKRNGVADA